MQAKRFWNSEHTRNENENPGTEKTVLKNSDHHKIYCILHIVRPYDCPSMWNFSTYNLFKVKNLEYHVNLWPTCFLPKPSAHKRSKNCPLVTQNQHVDHKSREFDKQGQRKCYMLKWKLELIARIESCFAFAALLNEACQQFVINSWDYHWWKNQLDHVQDHTS